ncbi:class F sortase [Nocardioides speluncae]|uniref:class F sortase n=1 Tax=Nocardioides speluncae TaxID=2670337 RepID=UPI000D69FDA8|nr:class F sortase [Nocardioides speluncae]
MSSSTRTSSRPGSGPFIGRALLAAAIVLAVAGACALAFAVGQSGAPQAAPLAPGATTPAGPAGPAGAQPASPRLARPVSLQIPSLGLDRTLLTVGLAADRTLEVPPFEYADQPGWYERFPTPGDPGTAIIVGHVDSPAGPAVFDRLGTLRAGDEVRVRRTDGRTAVFAVDRVATYSKDHFPTSLVYGAIGYPGLRLITCGGRYDADDGGYQDNTVAFASLTRFDRQTA